MKLTIAIDDVSPLTNYRILGEPAEKYLRSLNEKYGVEYTLFIPSNLHNQAPLSENQQWFEEMKDWGIFEFAAHGHYHMTSDRAKYGVMEFVEMTEEQCKERIKMMLGEWDAVGHRPEGWRNPGWVCQPYCVPHLSKEFKYAALHEQHNRGYRWGTKMIFGAVGINETEITLTDGNLNFQSHIYGAHIDNEWREENFKQLDLSLEYLFNNFEIEPTTLNKL